ncbi:MAG: hypothetical protein WC895_04050 [Candidatus Shapirobacteria bacterium]
MFRSLRKDDRFCYIGDYPLLANIVEIIESLNIKTNRSKLTHAFKSSSELNPLTKKEKRDLLDYLLKLCNTSIENSQIALQNHQKLIVNTNYLHEYKQQ